MMLSGDELQKRYRELEYKIAVDSPSEIQTGTLLAFPREDKTSPPQSVVLRTEEFGAICPWTGLPDQGTLTISYVPQDLLIEMKALKFYLMSYRTVGMVQEDVTDRLLKDLSELVNPREMDIVLNYLPRGGISTECKASLQKEDWPV